MFSFKKSLTALVGLLVFIGIVVALVPRVSRGQGNSQNAPPPFNVKVINSPSEPVPVTGTVSVSNLGNSPLPVRDVDNPARQPFQARLCVLGTPAACAGTGFPTSVTVPAGKRLVIEQIAGQCFPGTTTLAVGLTVTVNSTTVTHLFGITFPVGTGITGYTNHTTRLYADGGTSVVGAHNSLPPTANVSCDIAFSGYLFTP